MTDWLREKRENQEGTAPWSTAWRVVLFAEIGNLAGGVVGQRAGRVMNSECSPEFEMFVSDSVEMFRGQLDTHCALTAQLLLGPVFLPTLPIISRQGWHLNSALRLNA